MDDLAIPAGAGPLLDLGGIGVHFKIRGRHTGGAFAVVEHPVEPGVVVEPHVHRNEDEFSFVLEGTIGVRVGNRETEAGPGAYVLKPRGIRSDKTTRGTPPSSSKHYASSRSVVSARPGAVLAGLAH